MVIAVSNPVDDRRIVPVLVTTAQRTFSCTHQGNDQESSS
jgi:hypothetical protein